MRWAFASLLVLSCSSGSFTRVTANEPRPAQCDTFYCGGVLAVTTSLSPETSLTESECVALCGSWCEGARPIGGRPGCKLLSGTELSCDATVYDCGWGPPPYCGPENCSGCCLSNGTCQLSSGVCGGVSCTECTERKCSAANCVRLSRCGGQLEAAPRTAACAGADGGVDSSWDSTASCVAACDASDAGEALGCAANLASSCDDAGVQFVAQCSPDAGSASACLTSCRADRETCDRSCTKSSFGSCMDCAASCGLTFAACAAACP